MGNFSHPTQPLFLSRNILTTSPNNPNTPVRKLTRPLWLSIICQGDSFKRDLPESKPVQHVPTGSQRATDKCPKTREKFVGPMFIDSYRSFIPETPAGRSSNEMMFPRSSVLGQENAFVGRSQGYVGSSCQHQNKTYDSVC